MLDQRRAEAKLMKEEREELSAACGDPTPLQRKLIERAALLKLRLHLMDKASMEDPVLSERNSRYYLAWSNSYNRCLAQIAKLGPLTDNSREEPSLDDVVKNQRNGRR